MASSREIDAPHTLASLPRPFDSVNGRTVAAGVHSLSGSKKRKRTEIATGIDGEGINVYSVHSPQLVTSYALPAHTYFTAPPCSIYRKGSKTRVSQRFTYAPVAQSLAGADAQVVCFAEETQRGDARVSTKSLFNIPKTTSNVVAIEVVPLVGTDEKSSLDHDVLSIHESGEVYCLSADLKTTRWKANVGEIARTQTISESRNGLLVEYVCLTTAKAVRKGLLRSRDDVLAALDPSMGTQGDESDTTHILCLVVRDVQSPEDKSRTLQILSIPSRASDIITSRRPNIQHMLAWNLPVTAPANSDSQEKPIYSLNSKSGVLHQLIEGAITTYDFSGTIPRVSSKLEVPETSLQSFVRLSSNLLFASSETYCGMYDIKYNSVQAVCPLKLDFEIPTDSKKRKAPSDLGLKSFSKPLKLLTYFPDIDLVVGLSKEKLVGIQLQAETNTLKEKRLTDALLIDSIGKGLRTKRQKPELPKKPVQPLDKCVSGFASNSNQMWPEAKLNTYAAHGNVVQFDKLFATAVRFSMKHQKTGKPASTGKATHLTPQKLPNGANNEHLINGFAKDHTPGSDDKHQASHVVDAIEWPTEELQLLTPIPDSARHLYRSQAIYALGKIFSWKPSSNGESSSRSTEATTSAIAISFYPPKAFLWLLLSGHFTKELIERALRERSPLDSNAGRSITDGDIVTAVVNFDPEFRLLLTILRQPTFLPVNEVVQAIRLLVQSLDDSPDSNPTPLLLTNGVLPTDGQDEMDIEHEIEGADQALNRAQSLLENGLAIRSEALEHALTRLHTFPASLTTSTLRNNMRHHEIGILIHLLRIQLCNGGWSSEYSDFYESNAEELSDRSITVIVPLLTCALDAVGIGGWLGSMDAPTLDESTDHLLWSLDDEVSETLKGVWEAGCLKGFVGDFLRYAWKTQKRQNMATEQENRKRGKPILVHRRDDEGFDAILQENMLPLGGRPAIENTKIRNNGVVEVRSKREMGMLISRRVPKYSIERIVI